MRRRGEGSVSWDGRAGAWRLRLPGEGRREVYLRPEAAPTHAAASAYLDELLRELERRGVARAPARGLTVGELALEVVTERGEGAGRNERSERSLAERYLAPSALGRLEVARATRADVAGWLAELARTPNARGRPPSASSLRHALGLARATFAAALVRGLVSEDPSAGIRPPRSGTSTRQADDFDYLRGPEILAVLTCPAIPPEARRVYTVAICTGARQGELWGLRWVDVVGLESEASRGARLEIRRSFEGPRKSGGDLATVVRVPLLAPARAALLEQRESARGDLVFPGPDGMRSRGNDAGWSDTRWRPVDPATGRADPAAAVRIRPGHRTAAGIRRPIPFHAFRHTCATSLLSGTWAEWGWTPRAATIAEVSAWLGHAAISTTERYYARFESDRLAALVE